MLMVRGTVSPRRVANKVLSTQAINDNLTHLISRGLNTTPGGATLYNLAVGREYLVEVWPDIGAGGSASDIIWGWLLSTGYEYASQAQGDGIRIATGYPRIIKPDLLHTYLYFMRDSNTAYPCSVNVHLL